MNIIFAISIGLRTDESMLKKKPAARSGIFTYRIWAYQDSTGLFKPGTRMLDKQGIIVDERFNGGGFASDMVIERLRRKIVALSNSRVYGNGTYPNAGYNGHLVMLMNKYAGSDGDYFPYYFKHFKLGKIVGTRTWGGVVGIFGVLPLMDGGMITVPSATQYDLKGNYIIENYGVDPDIEVDNLPQDEFLGKDAQLDRAIEEIKKQIKEKPVKFAKTPKDPVKNK